MLSAARALMRSRAAGGREFPKVPAFRDVYDMGWNPRYGEFTMVSARSGAGKSTFGLFFAAQSGLRTLYFSGDMSAFQASVKLACAEQHDSIDNIVRRLDTDEQSAILSSLPTNISFSFGDITFEGITQMVDAYVELHNEFPDLVVIDNLMDVEGCSEDYKAQMNAMQWLHNISRELGFAVMVMAHMSDKGERGRNAPHEPGPRSEIKNGLSEKPETILSMALNPHTDEMHIALVKNRLGAADPSGRQYATIQAYPEESRYERKGGVNHVSRSSDGVVSGSDGVAVGRADAGWSVTPLGSRFRPVTDGDGDQHGGFPLDAQVP